MMMDKFHVKSAMILFILISTVSVSTEVDYDGIVENGANAIITSLYSSWDTIKLLVHEAQNRFLPPTLDFRIQEKDAGSKVERSSERIKEAAKKSFEEGEATLEITAESAANAVHQAKHKLSSEQHERDAHQEL